MVNISEVAQREAVYDINRYISDQFYNLDPAILGQIDPFDVPFVPVQSDPQTDVPYIRYVTREAVDGDMWWMRRGSVSYAIYAYDVSHSARILNIIVDLLARGSDSAQELTLWRRSATTPAGNPYPQDYQFHSIEFVGGFNTEPTDEEAGAHVRFASFRYSYSPYGGTHIA